MTAIAVNLIPKAYRERRALASRARRWAAGSIALACVIGAAWALTASTLGGNRVRLASQLASARADADEKSRLLSEAQSAHAAAVRRLESARAVAGHPDWSVLLALLARARSEGLVLERVDVRPIASAETKPTTTDANAPQPVVRGVPAYQLDIRGVAESQSVVAQYLLSLENIGLFDTVRLRETRPRTIGARGVVEFGLDCAIAQSKPGAAVKSAGITTDGEGTP